MARAGEVPAFPAQLLRRANRFAVSDLTWIYFDILCRDLGNVGKAELDPLPRMFSQLWAKPPELLAHGGRRKRSDG